jgi:hypothetical protein
VARLAVAGSSGTKLLDQPKWEGVQPVQQAHAKKSIPAILRRNTEAFFETKSSVRYPILARSLHRSSLQAFGTTGLKLNNSMLPGMAKNQALQSRIAAMNPSDNFGQSSDALPRRQPLWNGATVVRPLNKAKRIDLYAYSFWRGGDSQNSNAPAAQYGGSQSGIIATYRLTQPNQPNVAALMRVAVTPGEFAEQELAFGLRWRPLPKLPLTVSAERRLRAKSKDQFAIYAAGSVEDIGLPQGAKLRGFGQTGVAKASRFDFFYDAGIRAERKIINVSDNILFAGAGAWAGGQSGVSRLDIGPTLRSEVSIGATRVHISGDWRFRVDGNARPGNGPAITVSTGF